MKPHTHRQQMNSLVAAKHTSLPATSKPLKYIAIATAVLLSSAAGLFAATSASVTLGWNANPESNIQRYELQYGSVPGNRPNTVDAGTNLSAAVSGLNPGSTYYFAVVARNTNGQASPPSTEITYTVPGTLNTAPVASANSLVIDEDSQAAVTLSATDSEADALTYSIVASPGKGTLLGTPPNLTYRAGLNQSGSDSFTFRAFDGVLYSSTVTVSVSITPINDAPVAVAKSATTNEDSSVSITLSGTDPDGDALTYAIVSPPTSGTLSGTGATRSYLPAANSSGSDSFTYTVSDGTLVSEPATVMITVTPVNDPPVASAGTATTAEDTPVPITLTGSDVEGSVLSYSLVGSPANGTVSGSPPNILYTPKLNYSGTDTVSFRVNDGTTNSATANVVVTITPVNDAPVAVAKSVSVTRDNPLAILLTGTDVEGSSLTYQIVSGPASGTLTGTPPNVSYKANSGFTGADAFSFRVYDGALYSAAAIVSVEVKSNTPPVATAKSVTTNEDTDLVIALSGTDADSDALTYAVVTQPTKGTILGSGASITYRPTANATGSDSFTFKSNDGKDDSATATVSITITPVNDPPVATARTASTAEDTPVSIVLSGSDQEGSALSFALVGSPANGSISGTPPNVIYTPHANFNGADSFTFRVNDGTVNSANATVSVTVTPVNDAPLAISRTISTARNAAVAVTLTGSDVDGNPLSYAVVGGPSNGSLSGTPPNLTYTPANDYAGTDSVIFRANDGTVNSANGTITISVANSNRAPQAHSKSVTTMVSKPIGVNLVGSDADANPLSYRIVTAPANGTLTGTPPNVTYKPKTKWTGSDRFTYVVNDGSLDSAAATVEVKVKKKNLKPVANLQSLVANQNGSVATVLTGTDPDEDPLTFTILAAPANGTITGTPPNVVYTPKPGYKGKDRFSFVANDGMVKSVAAVVAIDVINPNNRAPVPQQATTFVTPNNKPFPILLKASDLDGDALTFRIVERPTSGKLTGKGASLIYKPKKGFVGTVRLGFVVNDGSVDSKVGYIIIGVTAPPAPAARSLATMAAGGVPMPLPSLSIAASENGMVLTISGTPGGIYNLESSSDMSEWVVEEPVTIGESGTTTLKLAPAVDVKAGFYRLSE